MSENIFSAFDAEELKGMAVLINQLEESSFDFLKLENGDVKIVIGKNGMTELAEGGTIKPVVPASQGAVGGSAAVIEPPEKHVAETENIPAEETSATAPKKEIIEQEGTVIIKAPSYGLFYAQPAPGEPPYVEVGSMVKEGDTVGLYEVMKVFSSIAAPVNGEIVEIYVKNAEQLEPEQPLMAIKVE